MTPADVSMSAPIERARPRSQVRQTLDVALVTGALVLDLIFWQFDGRTRLGFEVPVILVCLSAIAPWYALVHRRDRPWVTYLVAWVYSVFWAALIPTYQPFLALLIAAYTFVRHRSGREARPLLILLLVPWALNTVNSVETRNEWSFVAVAVTAAIWFTIGAIGWLAARGGQRAQRMYELESAKLAAEAELSLHRQRLELAHELHDIVAHSISAIMFQAAGARVAAQDSDPQLSAALQSIESSSTQTMRELRRLLQLIGPEEGSNSLQSVASLSELDQLLSTTRACGIDVDFSQDGEPVALDPSVDHTAYRILQESLANAMRHGGVGVRAAVRLSWVSGGVRLSVRTTSVLAIPRDRQVARPADVKGNQMGLAGLARRVAGVGGQFNAGPEAGGFLVAAELPLTRTPLPSGRISHS